MKCNLCGSSDLKNVLKEKDLVECKKCGLVFFSVLPDFSEIDKLYNSEIYSPSEYYKKIDRAGLKTFREMFREISSHKAPGRMLDIGCSTGTMMSIARDGGWEIHGIELNKLSVEECKRKGFPVKNVTLEESNYADNYFDWINMGDVIEHVIDSTAMLRLVCKKLKKGGILTISTPDISKFLARKFQVKPKEHLFYFNKGTMGAMLERTGFKVVSIKNYAPYRNLSAMASSSTFNRKQSKVFFRALNVLGDVVVKLPKDELFAIAEKV